MSKTFKQQIRMARYSDHKVKRVPSHAVPEEYKDKEEVLVYSILNENNQYESYVSYKRSKISMKLINIRWKAVYYFNRITRKW